jgi:hypothetical protein
MATKELPPQHAGYLPVGVMQEVAAVFRSVNSPSLASMGRILRRHGALLSPCLLTAWLQNPLLLSEPPISLRTLEREYEAAPTACYDWQSRRDLPRSCTCLRLLSRSEIVIEKTARCTATFLSCGSPCEFCFPRTLPAFKTACVRILHICPLVIASVSFVLVVGAPSRGGR